MHTTDEKRKNKFPVRHERAPEVGDEVTPVLKGGRLEKEVKTAQMKRRQWPASGVR